MEQARAMGMAEASTLLAFAGTVALVVIQIGESRLIAWSMLGVAALLAILVLFRINARHVGLEANRLGRRERQGSRHRLIVEVLTILAIAATIPLFFGRADARIGIDHGRKIMTIEPTGPVLAGVSVSAVEIHINPAALMNSNVIDVDRIASTPLSWSTSRVWFSESVDLAVNNLPVYSMEEVRRMAAGEWGADWETRMLSTTYCIRVRYHAIGRPAPLHQYHFTAPVRIGASMADWFGGFDITGRQRSSAFLLVRRTLDETCRLAFHD